MHCELVVPGLLPDREVPAGAPAAPRVPALELLLARGRASRQPPLGLERWLARTFTLEEGAMPAGALTLLGAGGEPGEGWWLRADPVHLDLERGGVTLVPAEGFPLAPAEADALAASLNAHFAGTFELRVLRPTCWCLHAPGEVRLASEAPLELAGADVNACLPRGADAARWRAVLNEVQMALHAHPVNEARERRGEPAVNSLWVWGAGRLPKIAAAAWQSLCADDLLVRGLARLAGVRIRALPESAGEWLASAPGDGRHAVLLDALRAMHDRAARDERLRALEERWLAPLLAALKSGAVDMLSLHLPEAGLTVETVRGDLRRFWRRPRPLADLCPPTRDHMRSGRMGAR